LPVIAFLIIFPFVAAVILSLMKKHGKPRKYFIFASCALIVAAVLYFVTQTLLSGASVTYLNETKSIDLVMLLAEFGMMGLVVYYGAKYKKYYVALLSVVQTGLIAWMDLSGAGEMEGAHIAADKLTVVMALIIGIVGCLICIYAVGYMKDYHAHHTDCKDRRAFFFAMLFVFLGAMFGLVLSANITWIYFFWEITSLCSFLLIGYNQSEEAINNSFKALWMNLLGGLGFALAIVYCDLVLKVSELDKLVAIGVQTPAITILPVILLAFAGLTKSAQLPFSGWLLGAMVAPTPTSALLHSATMVKAGVYLLIRLSPAMCNTPAGYMVTTVGGFTFLMTSMLAISQSDGKKVLAYSTISNLGLIAACAGIGRHEAVWAAILLMMFHAVSKSLMFLSVGAVENATGSRNIEDMHGLVVRLPQLAFVMIIGIAGMFLAPFGMLISKWAALRAFIDAKSVLMIFFLVFGSATTLFYWTKWLGKLISIVHESERLPNTTKGSEWFSLFSQAFFVVALCITFPIASTYLVEPFLGEMFHDTIPAIIGAGNEQIMIIMLCMILILPVAVRILTFGMEKKVVMSYMAGANYGNDRAFTDSFGEKKKMYLANWYMEDYFGEKKLLKPSLVISSAVIIILIAIAIAVGGVI
jgi:NADH:ubiquinone oxidoreductase subunit 5 (chain L)/Multisubunit Na+/H+ antiporter, MnhA subunit